MVSSETKKRRRKAGQRRKKAERVEISLEELEQQERKLHAADEAVQQTEVVTLGLDDDDSAYEHFKGVFQKLQQTGEEKEDASTASEGSSDEDMRDLKKRSKKEAAEPAEQKLSKKELRKAARMSVAELKQVVDCPHVVEPHDTNSKDPRMLVHLKGYRNSVPIPRHWCHKRKYLSMKKGFTKAPFELPSFIAATGISRIRESYLEREEAKRERIKARDKTRVKIHRIDIDFHVLHDAFFKHQTPPPLSNFGELYYEGREKEFRYRSAKPGAVSDRLKRALGMPEGYPPPWLINMQRYGPPPSYPSLRIPGLNAPLPAGASWGYHAGGWGKAPVDPATAQPRYGGDVFAAPVEGRASKASSFWGEVEPEESDDDDFAAPDAAEEQQQPQQQQQQQDAVGGTTSVVSISADQVSESGIASVGPTTLPGTETPGIVDLRKRVGGAPGDGRPYQILEQTSVAPTGIMGSTFQYNAGKDQKPTELSLSESDIAQLQAGNTGVIRDKFDAEMAKQNRDRLEVSEAFEDERARRQKKDMHKKKKEFKF